MPPATKRFTLTLTGAGLAKAFGTVLFVVGALVGAGVKIHEAQTTIAANEAKVAELEREAEALAERVDEIEHLLDWSGVGTFVREFIPGAPDAE